MNTLVVSSPSAAACRDRSRGRVAHRRGPQRITRSVPTSRRSIRSCCSRGTAGFAHPSIPSAIAAIEALGDKRGFEVVATTDPNMFNPAELSKYAAVVFVPSTTGNGAAGSWCSVPHWKGTCGRVAAWVGAHAASDVGSDVRNGWPWFVGLVGAAFQGHTRTHVWAAAPVPGTVDEGPLARRPCLRRELRHDSQVTGTMGAGAGRRRGRQLTGDSGDGASGGHLSTSGTGF